MNLNTVQEIERAIDALTPQQLDELYLWLDQHHPQPIDARVQSDLAAGHLDQAIHRALDDEKNGRVEPISP
jgi:rhodanese-related sulfurtransferase